MRVLILEDNPLIALDLSLLIEAEGHEVAGPFGTLRDASAHLGRGTDFAVLDIDLPDGKSFDLAIRLAADGVPFAFVSGSRPADLPTSLRNARFVAKPFNHAAIRNLLSRPIRLAS